MRDLFERIVEGICFLTPIVLTSIILYGVLSWAIKQIGR